MEVQEVDKAKDILEKMKALSIKLERALDRADKDEIMEIKKEILDLQKQLSGII